MAATGITFISVPTEPLPTVPFILTKAVVFAQNGSNRVQTIDALDTVVFDLSQAVINGNNVEFPVSIISDDTINSLDFSLKYNQINLSYDTIIDLTTYLQSFAFYNNNDSTLRFTSYCFQAISHDTSLVSIHFNMLSAQIANADFNFANPSADVSALTPSSVSTIKSRFCFLPFASK